VSVGVSHDVPASSRAAFASGLGWKLSTQVVTQVTRFAVAILLARLMSPTQFGIAGLALVFAPLAYIFTDLGAALVQQKEQTEEDRSTAFWTSIVIGLGLTLVGIAAAEPIADFYGEPEVQPLFMVLSLSFAITAASTTQSALLHRAMAFRRIEIANMIAVLAASAVGVGAALLGWGAWAIILQLEANSLLFLILLWRASSWRPRWRFSWASLRGLSSFSTHNLGANLLRYLESNMDNLLIGRFQGPASLGVYSIAYNLMLYPVTRFAAPIHAVLFPLLARMQHDDARARRIWLRVTRLIAVLVAPAMVALIVVAPELIRLLLGSKWDEAAPLVQILALAGLVYAVRVPSTSVLLAKGEARTLFRFSLVSALVLVTGFIVTVSWGVKAVAMSFSAAFVIMTPALVHLASRAIGASMRAYARNLIGVSLATAAMAAVMVPAREALVHADRGAVLVLLVTLLVGAAVYAPLCLRLVPDLTREIGHTWRAVRSR
jgi:O-antigen/teichoic acid export membrane protein